MPDSNTWKITSSDSRRSTHLGQLCISISQIEGYCLFFEKKKKTLNGNAYVQWPPPPRKTPIIVPPHLRSTTTSTAHPPPLPLGIAPGLHVLADSKTASSAQTISQASVNALGAPKGRNKQSSLQKAVMDRLEVEQAMHEMRKK